METDLPRPLYFNPMRFPTPEAQCDEVLDLAETTKSMALIAWKDNARRSQKLRQLAAERCGIYFECERYRTLKLFRYALAVSLGVAIDGTSSDLYHEIEGYLNHRRPLLLLDHADRLTERQLRSLRSFHDTASCQIMMASAAKQLFIMADDRDTGGQFYSRCVYCDADQ